MRNFFQNPYKQLAGSSRNYTLPRKLLILKAGSFLFAILFLIASFFPSWFFWNAPLTAGFSNRDVIAIVDVSESMGATDGEKGALKTRLDAVKDFLAFIAEKNPKNRFSIIAFEKEARVLFPLSDDSPSFFAALGTLKPRMLTEHGSSLSTGLTEAKNTLSLASDPLILVFSDSGEWNISVPKELSTFSPIIYGVGSEDGARIPRWSDIFGTIIYRKYQGSDVIVRLDSGGLKKVAASLSGKYIHLEDVENGYQESFAELWGMSGKMAFPVYIIAALLCVICIIIPLKRKI